ncbi:hypothetical protein I7I53_01851 [Histoplasma capsulatum var. duboisii H88]|uniref:Uncharacterized protein n=1 Tax=Ajellomyces capsulatus (strain H88) TaxID=544711 RepID=A0A8A1LIZ7_AJEC8|nr:hypothetical protein I7I53_01851 [Histoplasma capsulatum var. duboisii H88]
MLNARYSVAQRVSPAHIALLVVNNAQLTFVFIFVLAFGCSSFSLTAVSVITLVSGTFDQAANMFPSTPRKMHKKSLKG